METQINTPYLRHSYQYPPTNNLIGNEVVKHTWLDSSGLTTNGLFRNELFSTNEVINQHLLINGNRIVMDKTLSVDECIEKFYEILIERRS